MSRNRIVDLAEIRSNCKKCSLFQLCMPMGLDDNDLEKLDKIIKRRRPVEKGDYLYRMGDPFHSVYTIRAGSLKTYTTNQNGQEQIIAFHLPGDLIGLDAIQGEIHTCSAKALETISVCEIPFDRLESLSQKIPGLQHHLLKLMSEELQLEHCHMTILARAPVEARLASFLTQLSERFRARGYSATEFNLSMSRNDIANSLGMAVETISRLLSQFQEHGLLQVERKHVQILDMPALVELSNRCGPNAQNTRDSSHGTA
ncbi:MAG: fumarate/nitrate reduction transcriptional regulator Fnr [Proteobacteria bacterium]|jgi:CRP/FNR family transcriptional regulator, anaerobic regulatory protein|nr:fumarate/nitrate reduction transcriptional regulator Fnr [Pseudomonadota bacterium]